MLSASDEEQLAFATKSNRVIFSHDADFLRIHSTGMQHAGIVYTANRKDVGNIIRNLKLIHDLLDSTEMINHVEFI
jgi:predicted nuclease of predicted toxin-antitoxin system